MNNNNIIERQGKASYTRVYKRTEYPKDYYNKKNKINNNKIYQIHWVNIKNMYKYKT